jgi:hypothetical protein
MHAALATISFCKPTSQGGVSMRLRTSRSHVALAAIAFLGAGLSAACVLEVDPEGPLFSNDSRTADLYVTWMLEGADEPSLCDSYGIETWTVELRGPESRDVTVDCRLDTWSTEVDLYNLYEGNYTVTLRAFSAGGVQLAAGTGSLGVFDTGLVNNLVLRLYSTDF